MTTRETTGHCPRCGSVLLTNGVRVWCSFVGGRGVTACSYGIDEPLDVSVLAAYWPSVEDIPCGRDIIGGPVAGMPDGETLSALVCDGYVTDTDS